MESGIDQALESILQSEDPRPYGVLLVDSEGLCLGAKGQAPRAVAPQAASIASRASLLSGSPSDKITIRIETETSSITIRPDQNFTLALFKSN
ncbi:uncharacterized protein BJ171DRAFT_533821 [Polychytrium aggregatum]|uniref:uncharacterized protein n=1 Tax=Polychytrium aggregatum TaxID=110093 RepID=UPI0022FE0563|nr:uncharacterized protein BJ171DRAFT_533821 [Polychytrium aggregatum]KAI9193122.1 hypothetical protein BJ171DRAFT_533821 [Polychytrium aggregatum]